jgi:hypothetical protein
VHCFTVGLDFKQTKFRACNVREIIGAFSPPIQNYFGLLAVLNRCMPFLVLHVHGCYRKMLIKAKNRIRFQRRANFLFVFSDFLARTIGNDDGRKAMEANPTVSLAAKLMGDHLKRDSECGRPIGRRRVRSS